ncbi:Pre-mRNA-splicing factor of RES complex-domain-containing protein [Scheffersomyces coipomensis]|uniref:Pre-mRNA-splicing factor of RES complex-domain-containing protein n=1 Tax=Scheffersomyces coipomensis TaxID=1788519 RepID=UPI00315D7072
MSSRSDYLSKYLSKGDDSKEKKKSKKHKKPKLSAGSNIIISHATNWNSSTANDDDPIAEDDQEESVNEEAPVKVEVKNSTQFKGFKRIDNGNEVSLDPVPTRPSQDEIDGSQQETVYRDSKGRVIDINARKQQFEADKKDKENERTFEEIRTTKESQLQQEINLKNAKSIINDEFEDPLNIFQSEKSQKKEVSTSSSQYVYNKGMIPLNRFDIKPGYFWDGIDRSNGFEELALRKQNEKKFKKLESRINESYGDLDYD